MTGAVQVDRVVLGQVRLAGVQLKRQLGACEDEVEGAQRLVVLADGFRALCHTSRQLGENALDLLLLASLEYLELVVDLDDLCRLDEQRRARTRGVVHKSRYVTAVLGLDRHDETSVSLGDDSFL